MSGVCWVGGPLFCKVLGLFTRVPYFEKVLLREPLVFGDEKTANPIKAPSVVPYSDAKERSWRSWQYPNRKPQTGITSAS